MKCRAGVFLIAFLFLTLSYDCAYAQHSIVKKDIAFIARKSDRVKNIAVRFHLSASALTRLNTPLRKRQMVYAGKKLLIPVWLRSKTAHPAPGGYDIADYELDTDSLDAYIHEDFVCVADIEADTMRKITIEKDIRKIDRGILSLSLSMDSIEAENVKGLSNRELKKLQMAKERHTGDFTMASQIDSLRLQRRKLTEERAKIDLRLADYEDLLENASYMAAHPPRNDRKLIHLDDWADDPSKISDSVTKNKKVGQL